jgi:DNA-binding winged helix-turn-helix (wHTH) protein
MYAFGAFELDPLSHELRRGGVRIKVQDQPFTILVKLLERPGQLVTREELRSALWTGDTFVDFDTSLNSAIKRLREALGDSAEAPAFIETLPKLGYRFVGRVEIRSPAPLRAPDRAESHSFYDFSDRTFTELMHFEKHSINPVLSPDGTYLIFEQTDEQDQTIMLVNHFR